MEPLANHIQTTLFTSNTSTLKLFQNLPNYQHYWKKQFPNVISEHIATDQFKILSISDGNSELDTVRKKITLIIPTLPFLSFWKKLNRLLKTNVFSQVTMIAYGKELLYLIPKDLPYEILLDWGHHIQYSSSNPQKRKSKSQNKTLRSKSSPNTLQEIWGRSFGIISQNLIHKQVQNLNIYIKTKGTTALRKKIMDLSTKAKLNLSIPRFDEALTKIVKYSDYLGTLDKKDSKSHLFLDFLELSMFSHYICIKPKYREYRAKNVCIFLAKLREE